MERALIDHERARYVEGRITERYGAAGPVQEARKGELEKYRSAALNAVPFLRQTGLLQLAAFWNANKKDAPEHLLLGHLLKWLTVSPVTKELFPSRPVASAESALASLLSLTSDGLALAEAEAEALLGWVKRIVEGRYKEAEHLKQTDEQKAKGLPQ